MIAYVLQQEQSSLERSLYNVGRPKPGDYPKTVLIKDTKQFYGFKRQDILARSKEYAFVGGNHTYRWAMLTEKGIEPTEHIHYSKGMKEMKGLEVPPEIASYYKLVEGDEVGISVDHTGKTVFICSVNGCQDPKIFRFWKSTLSEFQSDYPKKPLPLEKYGCFDLRVISLLAPWGLGGAYWFIGSGGCGKTWILVEVLNACLQIASEDNNIYIMMGYVGDRPEDAAQYISVFDKYPKNLGEFHEAPWNTNPDTQVDVTKFVIKRAHRLTAIGKHVIVLFDAISRTVAAHTASSYSDNEGGMISGGIRRQSLTDIIAMLFGTHGSFGDDRSLTIIGTVLAADSNKKTSEGAVDQETSDSSTTAICRLLRMPTLEYPRISVNESETYTRYPEGRDFRSEAQKQEMARVKLIMRPKGEISNSYDAHKELLKYAREHPFPSY